MRLPVSVVVPHLPSRGWFFDRYSLPSLKANGAAQIIIEDGPGTVAEKRNLGAQKAREPYLMFCDDDVILGADCIALMLGALEDSSAGFAYCDYLGVVAPGVPHYLNGTFLVRGIPFDPEALRRDNYISTMSLMRRELFTGFDASLKRFIDWDLWLTLAGRGVTGHYIPEVLFHAYNVDQGMSSDAPRWADICRIKEKHGIPI